MENKKKNTLRDKWEDFEYWIDEFYRKKPVLTMFLAGVIVTLMGLFGIVIGAGLLAFIITLHWAIVVFVVFPIFVGIYFAIKQAVGNF